MKIGIIGAMEKEIEALRADMTEKTTRVISGMRFDEGKLCGRDVVLAVAGIGKVNAAMCTQTMILTYAPNVILNTGVAGGIGKGLRVMDVVVATAVAQHDLDTTAFGDPMGLIPGLNVVEMPCDETVCRDVIAAAERIGEDRRHQGALRCAGGRDGGGVHRPGLLGQQGALRRDPRHFRRRKREGGHGLPAFRQARRGAVRAAGRRIPPCVKDGKSAARFSEREKTGGAFVQRRSAFRVRKGFEPMRQRAIGRFLRGGQPISTATEIPVRSI